MTKQQMRKKILEIQEMGGEAMAVCAEISDGDSDD